VFFKVATQQTVVVTGKMFHSNVIFFVGMDLRILDFLQDGTAEPSTMQLSKSVK
jgi:hypothetical protein